MTVNSFTCTGCGVTVKSAKPLAVGTSVRCPKCQAVNRIAEPGGDEAPPPSKVAKPSSTKLPVAKARPAPADDPPSRPRRDDKRPAKARRYEEDEDEDEDEEDDRPRKKGKKKAKAAAGRSNPVVQGILLVVAVAGIGVGGWMIYSKQHPKDEKAKDADDDTPKVSRPSNPGNPVTKSGVPAGQIKEAGVIREVNTPNSRTIVAPSGSANAGPTNDAAQKVRQSIVGVRSYAAGGAAVHGTGFFAFRPDLILTNFIALGMNDPNGTKPRVEINLRPGADDQTVVTAEIVQIAPDTGLTVLRVPPGTTTPPALDFTNVAEAKIGQSLWAMGASAGQGPGRPLANSVKVGSAKLGIDKEVDRYNVPFGLNPSNVGGPVMDDSGALVGIAVVSPSGGSYVLPAQRVSAGFGGRISDLGIGEAVRRGSGFAIPITIRTFDPLGAISKVSVDYWVGPPGDALPPSSAQPALPANSEERKTATATYKSKEGSATAELTLAAIPPDGKVLWVQPSYVNDKGSRWQTAIGQPIENPADPKDVTLTLKSKKGQRPMTLTSKLSLDLVLNQGERHTLDVNTSGKLIEDTRTVEANGNSTVIVAVMTMGNEVKSDGRGADSSEGEVKENDIGGRIQVHLTVDRQGNVTDSKLGLAPLLARVPQAIARAEQVRESMDLAAIPLPNGTVKYGQAWKAKRSVPIAIGSDATQSGVIDMRYTYAGVRSYKGKDVAVIRMEGGVAGAQGKSQNLAGKARGTALVEVNNGYAMDVNMSFDMGFDLTSQGQPAHGDGKLVVHVTRGVAGLEIKFDTNDAPKSKDAPKDKDATKEK
jgi:S1-C subfamily serine protease